MRLKKLMFFILSAAVLSTALTCAGDDSVTDDSSDNTAEETVYYTLNIDAGAATVTLSPEGTEFEAGTEVTVTLTLPDNQCLTSWSGDATGNDNPLTIIMDADKSISAAFSSCYAVGGTLSGLSGTIVLQNNGGDDLSLDADGSFTFSTLVADSENYAVSILTMPAGEYCTVSSSTGTISGAAVTSVSVSCSASGSADTTFAGDGMIQYSPNSFWNWLNALAVQDDDSVVVAGLQQIDGSTSAFGVLRYDSDGNLDTTFGTSGMFTQSWGGGISAVDGGDEAHDIAIQNDGKIVVVGYGVGTGADFGILRLNTDGTLDTTFDTDGLKLIDFAAGTDIARGVAIDADGKIVIAGQSGTDVAVVRLNSDGSLDTTFDTDGMVTTDWGYNEVAYDVAILSTGRIAVTGQSTGGALEPAITAVYNTDGSLYADFGSAGKQVYAVNGVTLSSIIAGADGAFVAAGDNGSDIMLIHYTSTGSLVTGFGTSGVVTTDLSGGVDRAYALAVDSAGRYVVSGLYNNSQWFFARYTTDGSLDTTFDSDGILNFGIGTSSSNRGGLGFDSEGRILGAGTFQSANPDFGIVRILP